MLQTRRLGPRGLLAAAVAGLLVVPLTALGAGSAVAVTAVDFVQRASGLSQPTQVTSARDGSGRLFVTEKTGRVRVYAGGRLLAQPFLDLRSRVRTDGEGGLLSIAFHPHYRAHPVLWVAYTDLSGDLRVARFRAGSATANRVPLSSYHRVIDVAHPTFSNHYGGQLAFGRAGLLFISTGDGGSAGDPSNQAQDVRKLQGKILRLTVVGARKACGALLLHPERQPLRRAASRAGRDLGCRTAQPVALLGRPGHRRPVGRRRRPGPVRGDRPHPGRCRRRQPGLVLPRGTVDVRAVALPAGSELPGAGVELRA